PYIIPPNYSNPYTYNSMANPYSYSTSLASAPAATESVLKATGAPTRDGKLDWPLALKVLPGADPLRQKIEGLYDMAAAQASSGQLSPSLPLELYRAVEQLQSLLNYDQQDRLTFSTAMYEQSREFLAQLKRAAQALPGVASAGTAG